jgi:hypothetical protein
VGGDEPPGDAAWCQEPTGAGSTDGTTSGRAGHDVAGSRESRAPGSDTMCERDIVCDRDMRYVPLLPWVRLRPFLIHSITSTERNEMTRRLVKPILRRVLQMRRQMARNGWCNQVLHSAGRSSWPHHTD